MYNRIVVLIMHIYHVMSVCVIFLKRTVKIDLCIYWHKMWYSPEMHSYHMSLLYCSMHWHLKSCSQIHIIVLLRQLCIFSLLYIFSLKVFSLSSFQHSPISLFYFPCISNYINFSTAVCSSRIHHLLSF